MILEVGDVLTVGLSPLVEEVSDYAFLQEELVVKVKEVLEAYGLTVEPTVDCVVFLKPVRNIDGGV